MSDVTTKQYDWSALCKEADGAPEPELAYEFSTGRTFERPENGGVYAD